MGKTNSISVRKIKLKSLMWLKLKRLEQYNLLTHPRDIEKVDNICKRYIEIETKYELIK